MEPFACISSVLFYIRSCKCCKSCFGTSMQCFGSNWRSASDKYRLLSIIMIVLLMSAFLKTILKLILSEGSAFNSLFVNFFFILIEDNSNFVLSMYCSSTLQVVRGWFPDDFLNGWSYETEPVSKWYLHPNFLSNSSKSFKIRLFTFFCFGVGIHLSPLASNDYFLSLSVCLDRFKTNLPDSVRF